MNKTKIRIIMFSAMLIGCSVIGYTASGVNPELEKIKRQFETNILPDHKEIIISVEDNKLVAQYHTNKFMIHTVDKLGHLSEKPHEELGPNYDGVLLNISIHEGRYQGAALVPQELTRPYWKTYINAYGIPNEDKYLWCSLSYGVRTDPKLISKIKDLFKGYVMDTSGVSANNKTINK